MRLLILLALACAYAAAQVPGLPPSVALNHILIDPENQNSASDFHPATQGMAVFRIVANADGSLNRSEFIAGRKELRADAEKLVSQLHFRPLRLKDQTEPTPWWSFTGICYGVDWPNPIPCEPPSLKPEDFTAETVPTRLMMTSAMTVSASYSLKLGPFKRIKGRQFERPNLAQLARIQGTIVLGFRIQTDGTVSDIQVFTGHPMLVEDAANKVRNWKFSTVTFNGQPVGASVTMSVYYSGRD